MAANASAIQRISPIQYESNDDRIQLYRKMKDTLSEVSKKCDIIKNIRKYSTIFLKKLPNDISSERPVGLRTIYTSEESIISMILSEIVMHNISPHFYLFYDVIYCTHYIKYHTAYKKSIYDNVMYLLYEKCQKTFDAYFGIIVTDPFDIQYNHNLKMIYTTNQHKKNDYDSFIVQMKMAYCTLESYGIRIADRQGKNFMYLSIDPDCYLYYQIDNKHIYIKSYGKLWVLIDYDESGCVKPIKKLVYDASLFKDVASSTEPTHDHTLIISDIPHSVVVFNTVPYRLFDETINPCIKYKPKIYNSIELPYNIINNDNSTQLSHVAMPMPTFSFGSLAGPINLKETDAMYTSTELNAQYLKQKFPTVQHDTLTSVIEKLWTESGSIQIDTNATIQKWNYKFISTILNKPGYSYDFFIIKIANKTCGIWSCNYSPCPAENHFISIVNKYISHVQAAGRYKRKSRTNKKIKKIKKNRRTNKHTRT